MGKTLNPLIKNVTLFLPEALNITKLYVTVDIYTRQIKSSHNEKARVAIDFRNHASVL